MSDIFPLYINKPDFHCKVFEDHQSCIAMIESSKLSPQTKHTALKYHQFKSFADSNRLRIIYTCSEDQLADILTKPLLDGQFIILRKVLNGWLIVTSICEVVLRYKKKLHFISVLVVLQLSKLFIIVFWNVHVLYTYFGMLNSEIKFSKTRIDNIDASFSLNQYLITFLK